MKLREVYERIDALYPKKISDDYVAAYGGHDNSGILLDGGHEIAGALFSLDLSQGAIAAAKKARFTESRSFVQGGTITYNFKLN